MYYIFKPEDWSKWAKLAIDKINQTIDTCVTHEHIKSTKAMVDNFIVITALEENVNDDDLECIIRLFWLKLDLKKQIIFETNKKELI
jgi:hypothetical protein